MKKSLGARTILLPTPVLLVGTYDGDGRPNLMTAAWGGICCSAPPCVSVSLRKATYSYSQIVERKSFTIGIPMESQAREADYAGMASGRDVDKFSKMGLTLLKSELVDAPYAEEIPFVIECKLIHSLEIGLHTLFVGEIMDIKADESILGENNLPDINKLKPLAYDTANRSYYGIGNMIGKAFSLGKDIG